GCSRASTTRLPSTSLSFFPRTATVSCSTTAPAQVASPRQTFPSIPFRARNAAGPRLRDYPPHPFCFFLERRRFRVPRPHRLKWRHRDKPFPRYLSELGMQQGLDYATTPHIPFVFSSNGGGFVFHDRTGSSGVTETNLSLDTFPSSECSRASTTRLPPTSLLFFPRTAAVSCSTTAPAQVASPRQTFPSIPF